jgi:glycosyltransferase involved in cell wall biosynthesis
LTIARQRRVAHGAAMRIAHYYPWGSSARTGVTQAMAEWSRALIEAGASVTLLHADEPASDGQSYHREVEFKRVPHIGRGRQRVSVRLAPELRQADLLVLHEGWVASNVVAAFSAQRAGVPYVLVPHGCYDPRWFSSVRPPLRLRAPVEGFVLERALAVHLFHPTEKSEVRALAPEVRCIVAPTGFRVPEQRWVGGGGYLAWFGRYHVEMKGLDLLLQALAEIPPETRPRLRMRGVDYGGGLAKVRQLAAELGLGDAVEVEGPIWGAEKLRFLLDCDGYIHPSRWDCLPGALLEALALGVPCVVSSQIHMGLRLRESEAAIVSDLDRRRLSQAMIQLTDTAHELGPRGRAFVTDEFSWPVSVQRFLSGVEEALALRA